MPKKYGKNIFSLLVLFMLGTFIFACSDSSGSDDGDNDIIPDGDMDLVEAEKEIEIEAEIDLPEIDNPEQEEMEEDKDPDFVEKDSDKEKVEVEKIEEVEPEPDIECEISPDYWCFNDSMTGYKCLPSNNPSIADTLHFCSPEIVDNTHCIIKDCKCRPQQVCKGACVDPNNGLAECGPDPDGDEEMEEQEADTTETSDGDTDAVETDAETDTDIDATTEIETETDLPEAEPEIEYDSIDIDGELYTCKDDAYEASGNDSKPKAAPLSPGKYDISICPRDEDWFVISASPTDTISIDITSNIPAIGEITVWFYDSAGTKLHEATNSYRSNITHKSNSGGVYYVYVFGKLTDSQNDYELEYELIEVLDGDEVELEMEEAEIEKEELVPPCPDDQYVGNQTKETALALTSPHYSNLVSCKDTKDYYSIDLKKDDYLTVNLWFNAGGGNIDINSYHFDDSIASSGFSTGNNETIILRAEADGKHILEVFLKDPNPYKDYNEYAMDIHVESSSSCVDDSFEENDSVSEAKLPGVANHPSLKICGIDTDWYEFPLLANESIKVDLIFTDALGNINAEMYNEAQEVVDSACSESDNEQLIYTTDKDESVFVIVYSELGFFELDYDMNVITSFDAFCNDDEFEDNDISDDASQLPIKGTWTHLGLCTDDDDDWYKFDLEKGWHYKSEVHFPENTPMQVILHQKLPDNSLKPLTYSGDIPEGLETYWKIKETGTYYLQARTFVPQFYYYDLIVDICPEDTLEPNDTPNTSSNIEDFSSGDYFTICSGNPDWYYVNLEAGETVSFAVDHDPYTGDLDLFLRDGENNILKQSAHSDKPESVQYTTSVGASYYFEVVGANGAENTYRINYSIY